MEKFELSQYQKDIMNYIDSTNSNLLVDAKAGSGKTSTLILVSEKLNQQNQNSIFLSFNKSIVEELQEKLPDSIVKTIHSLGMTFIRSYLYKKHNKNYVLEVDSSGTKLRTLCKEYYDKYFKQIVTEINKDIMSADDLTKLHTDLVNDFISVCNFIRLYGNDYGDVEQVRKIVRKFTNSLAEASDEYLTNYYELVIAVLDKTIELFQNPSNTNSLGQPIYVIDFVDMIYFPVYFNMSIPYSLKNSLDTVLTDETQDLSMLQQMFVSKLNTGNNRFIFVGDRNQCQPAGTKILMADLTEKNIEDVKVGDMVVSYDTKASYFRQQTTRCKGNKVLETKRLKADGYYTVVLDNGKSSNYTYNHKCCARINTNIGYITYIMGTIDGKFRIGYTRLFNNNSKINGFGLRMRMRQEHCKYGWILNYHKDRESAYMEEQLLSYKYQIPQCIFTDGTSHKIPRNNIEWFYNNFGYENIKNNVIKCLKDYGRSIDYPFVTVGDCKRHITRKGISVYETCNLIPEIMEFMYFDENNKKNHYRTKCNVVGASFSKIQSITYKQDECYVYCLKIDKLENYVADKILTHNCIYAFSGADTHSIDRLKYNFQPKELPLSICYRCPKKIIKLAQQIVPSIEWNPNREDTGHLEAITYTEMKKMLKPNDILIGRRNKDLLKIYKDFTLGDKKQIKFKNKELVNSIIKSLINCIKDYMLLYAKGQNIDKVVYEHMMEFSKRTHYDAKTKEYKNEMNDFIKQYAKEHSVTKTKKPIMKANQTLDYLQKCMEEFKEYGAYEYDLECDGRQYYDIIMEFINEYKAKHVSVLVDDFIYYLKDFLNGSNNYIDVPIISSVHSMKGGEANRVFIYDYPKFPYEFRDMSDDEKQQEYNLQYVAITRAKKELFLMLLDPKDAPNEDMVQWYEDKNKECQQMVKLINQTS